MSGQQGNCGLTVEIQINGAVDRQNAVFLPCSAGRNAIEKSTRRTSFAFRTQIQIAIPGTVPTYRKT